MSMITTTAMKAASTFAVCSSTWRFTGRSSRDIVPAPARFVLTRTPPFPSGSRVSSPPPGPVARIPCEFGVPAAPAGPGPAARAGPAVTYG